MYLPADFMISSGGAFHVDNALRLRKSSIEDVQHLGLKTFRECPINEEGGKDSKCFSASLHAKR